MADNLDITLPILGQGDLDVYTALCFCFANANPKDDASNRGSPTVLSRLEQGLERLAASVPWIAGQVVNEGACEGDTGIYKIKPLGRAPHLVVRDHRNDSTVPTWNALKEANFPISMLEERLFASRNTLGEGSGVPVFELQVNFVDGGLILTFVAQHHATDIPILGLILQLLCKAIRNEPFTGAELAAANFTPGNEIPFYDETWQPGPEYDKPASTSSDAPAPPPQASWACFNFSRAALSALKAHATETKDASTPFISTDDAIDALVWQSVARARLPRFPPATTSVFGRAFDARRYVSLPAGCAGSFADMAQCAQSLQELASAPLGEIAAQLRRRVDLATSGQAEKTRALATALHRARDKRAVNGPTNVDMTTGMMLSSWANMDVLSLDFGLGLGMPVVRRPRFESVESLMYQMPKASNGDIALLTCLRDEDMEFLRKDEEFGKYATYIG